MADGNARVYKVVQTTTNNATSNQTENLIELQDSAGTVIGSWGPTGLLKRKNKVAGGTVTVGNEASNVRIITIQLTDELGSNIATAVTLPMVTTSDAAGLVPAAAGSTGLETNTAGSVFKLTTNCAYLLTTNATGGAVIKYTDTGTDTAYLAIIMPDGTRILGSQALTNA